MFWCKKHPKPQINETTKNNVLHVYKRIIISTFHKDVMGQISFKPSNKLIQLHVTLGIRHDFDINCIFFHFPFKMS